MSRKRIWYIQEYNQLPGETWRESRSELICKYLSETYDVIWWTGSFDHHSKKQRNSGKIKVNDHLMIYVVKTSEYQSNSSPKRMIRDLSFGLNMGKLIRDMKKPDMIYSGGNPLRFFYPEYPYAKRNDIPIIADLCDLWPEVFEMVAPKKTKLLVHVFTLPMYYFRRKAYRLTRGLISTGTHHLAKLKQIPGDNIERLSEVVYNGIDVKKFREGLNRPVSSDVSIPIKNKGDVWCVFSGTLGVNYDIELIIDAAAKFQQEGLSQIQFFVTGNGPKRDALEHACRRLSNLHYLGIVSLEDLISLYGQCDVGVAPYKSSESIDMPDKLFDYYAAGLAVICSLHQDAGDYVKNCDTGRIYEANCREDFILKLKEICSEENLRRMQKNSYKLGDQFDINKQLLKAGAMIEKIIEN